ncbi:MAG: nitric-oxide reductase, partial [Methyloprofundus sp.]|nr:nitric-oxide reductase [Methyloprofundus sp.]
MSTNAEEVTQDSSSSLIDNSSVFHSWAEVDDSNLNDGQKLAVKYFMGAVILFIFQILFGLLAAAQFIYPSFLYEFLDFSVNRM